MTRSMLRLVCFSILLIPLTACSQKRAPTALPNSIPSQPTQTVTSVMPSRSPLAPTPTSDNVEAEAKAYPSALPPIDVPSYFQTLPGTSERKCVSVADYERVRSGEFVAGNFRHYIQNWKPNPEHGKIYWEPLHTERLRGLTVRAILLNDPRVKHTYGQELIATSESGRYFYPTDIPLPTSGTWRLIATSGPDWGCFELKI